MRAHYVVHDVVDDGDDGRDVYCDYDDDHLHDAYRRVNDCRFLPP